MTAKTKECQFSFNIPSIKKVCDGQITDIQAVIDSDIKLRVDFSDLKTAKKSVALFLLHPSMSYIDIAVQDFFDDPQRLSDGYSPSTTNPRILLQNTEFNNVASNAWLNVVKIPSSFIAPFAEEFHKVYMSTSVSHNRNGVHAIGWNLVLKLMYPKEITDTAKPIELEILNDFAYILKSGEYADIAIVSVEGEEFQAHKNILANRCAVFKAFFQHDTIEANTNVIKTEFNSDTLENLLIFLYSDQVPKLKQLAENLLLAADYYQLDRLKYICGEELVSQLTVDNVVRMLDIAITHSCPNLKDGALAFIKTGDLLAVTESKGWSETNNVAVFKAICVGGAVTKRTTNRFQ